MLYLTKNKKSPFYQIIYFVNGKRTTISTKEKKKSSALKFLMHFKEEFTTTPRINEQISLYEFYDKYLTFCKTSKSKKYVKSIELSFRILFKYTDKMLTLDRLTNRKIDNFIIEASRTAEKGVNVYIRTLKAAFSKAVDWNYLNSNPFQKVKLNNIPKNNDKIISKSELKKIVSVVKNKTVAEIIEVAFYTGMRLGEIINLKNKSIDFESRIIRVENNLEFHVKSKRERAIPMCIRVVDIIKERYQADVTKREKYLFGKLPDVKFSDSWISRSFKRAIRDSNLDDGLHFHSLRHAFCSNLVKNNVNLRVVMQLAGHRDYSTSMRYSHLQNKDLVQAINSFDEN